MKVIDGVIGVELSSDEFEARARLLQSEEPPDCRLIAEALQKAKIRFGLLHEALEKLKVPGEDLVLVAEGVRPGQGDDGWVEYLFCPPPEAGDTADPRSHPVVRNTHAGEAIAILHPPTEGTAGKTVTGKVVPGKPGRRATFELGANVLRDRNDPSRVIAGIDGNIVPLPNGELIVVPVLSIPGDVDLTVGDIDFVGTVKVGGDVRGGVAVRAGKHAHVFGGVEDAVIECGGDVTVDKGFIGHGQGRICAGGDVRVHHVRNQLVRSRGNVFIGVESIDARIEAEGKVTGVTAALIGGCVEAGGGVEMKTIGNSENSRVSIRAGRRGRILLRLAEIDKGYREIENQLRLLRQDLYGHNLARIRGPLHADQAKDLQKVQTLVDLTVNKLGAVQREREALVQELRQARDPNIVVHHIIHENVSIDINGARMVTDAPMTQVVFVKERHRIVPMDLEWRRLASHVTR